MDVASLRADFPILRRSAHGHPIVYLDSAATSHKPSVVVDAEARYYAETNANVHRGVYELSVAATEAYEGARARVARFVGAESPEEIVFLRGTTEGLNLLASSLGRAVLRRGDHVLTTVMEHHSNIVPWQLLREDRGIALDFVDIDDDGKLRQDDYERLLRTQRPKVVTFTHVSNVLGTVNPVRELADRAHDAGALVVLDAAQSVPHRALDVDKLGVDFVAFSGHKMLGPMGIGVLWGRREHLAQLPPYMGGGEMIEQVRPERTTFREPPARFEAGTPNVGGAVALAAAIDYLERIGWDALREHELRLLRRIVRGSETRAGGHMKIYGPPDPDDREAVVSFALQGAHPHDIANLLDAEGVCVRAGHHCAQPLMQRLRVPALSRVSPYLYNTEDEIDRFFDALDKVDALFSRPTVAARAAS